MLLAGFGPIDLQCVVLFLEDPAPGFAQTDAQLTSQLQSFEHQNKK